MQFQRHCVYDLRIFKNQANFHKLYILFLSILIKGVFNPLVSLSPPKIIHLGLFGWMLQAQKEGRVSATNFQFHVMAHKCLTLFAVGLKMYVNPTKRVGLLKPAPNKNGNLSIKMVLFGLKTNLKIFSQVISIPQPFLCQKNQVKMVPKQVFTGLK